MPKVIRLIVTGSAFAFFFLGGGLLSWVVFPLLRLSRKHDEARTIAILASGYRKFVNYMRIMGLIEFNPPPLPDDFNPSMPCVVIANHPSLIDVLLISTVIPKLKFVVKASWYQSKWIYPLLRLSNYIPSTDYTQANSMQTDTLDTMVSVLKCGESLLIFPEGSRSPRHGLRRFRRGACEAAIRAEVPILPILISVEPPMLLKNQAWYELPPTKGKFTFEFLPMIFTKDRNLDAKQLNQELYNLYRNRLRLK